MEVVKDSVAFLMPCAGPIDPRVLQSMGTVVAFSCANGYQIRQVGITDRTLIHVARQFLAQAFLQSECEWAFWMDSDMILEPRTIPVMINWLKKLNGKLATGIYYQRMGIHKPLIFLKDPKTADGKSIHEMPDEYSHCTVLPKESLTVPCKVDATGFGCFLMHRDALVNMDKPYFKNHYFGDGKEVSEDFYFCIKSRQLGLEIWAIPELDCGHIGTAPIITKKDFKHEVKPEEVAECLIQVAKGPERDSAA